RRGYRRALHAALRSGLDRVAATLLVDITSRLKPKCHSGVSQTHREPPRFGVLLPTGSRISPDQPSGYSSTGFRRIRHDRRPGPSAYACRMTDDDESPQRRSAEGDVSRSARPPPTTAKPRAVRAGRDILIGAEASRLRATWSADVGVRELVDV